MRKNHFRLTLVLLLVFPVFVFAKGYDVREMGKTDEVKIDQPNNDLWFYELEFKRK